MQRPKKKSLTFALVFTLVNLSFVTMQTANAAPEAWTSKASMQTARSYPGVAVVNERIYVIGGNALSQLGYGETNKAINTNEEYNPETDTWNYKEPMPTSRYQFATVTYENKVYCIGGKTNEGVTGVNEVYDPATDTWENRSSMPTPRMKIQANLVDEKIYIISTGVTEVYDPKTDTWTTKAPTSNRITSAASAFADDKIYFLATLDCRLDLGAFIQVYDTKNDVWSKAGPAPTYGESATTAPTPMGSGESKRIVFFQYSSTLIYYPTNDSWARGTTIPNSRGYVGVALLNDVYYVIGGIRLPFNPFAATSSVGTNAQYNPIENTTIEADMTIYIRSDGRIEPSTANITTTDNVTYMFTENNYERMIIERDNIILDGKGFTLKKSSSVGVSLFERQNVTIKNLRVQQFSSSEIGIENSADITITGNTLSAYLNEGVDCFSCSNITVTNNTISGGFYNIWLTDSNNNIISHNKMGRGLMLLNSENNLVTHNKITSAPYCLNVADSSNNQIYLNSFLATDYLETASTYGEAVNMWNSSYPAGGNYWEDYNGTDSDGDGIGDTPYIIDENNIDYQPIMAPIQSFYAGTWEEKQFYIDINSNSAVSKVNFKPETRSITILNGKNEETEENGFCKVTIPKDLLQTENEWTVLTDGKPATYSSTEVTSNTYVYVKYNQTAQTIEIIGTTAIPELQPWTIPVFFMATALVAAMFYKRIQKTENNS